jgi:hypothetical protein
VDVFRALEPASALSRRKRTYQDDRPGGAVAPPEVLAAHTFNSGYAVCLDFLSDEEIKRWSRSGRDTEA